MKDNQKYLKLFNSFIGQKYNILFIIILALGFFLRIWNSDKFFLYGHDQDLSSWFVKDVLVNKHLRLIGQETSTQGVFIGSLYYYLLIPFYLLSSMDPIGGIYLVLILGVIAIVSVYFVITRIFGRNVGIIASIIYSVSYYTVFNDREVVPTMPVMLFSVWFMYGVDLLFKGDSKKAYIISGILAGLVWQINFALVLLFPLLLVAQLLSKKKFQIMNLFYGIVSFIISSLPLIFFEIRHNFPQIKAIKVALTTNQFDIISGFDKLTRILYLFAKNVYGLFMGSIPWFKFETIFYILIIIFVLMVYKKIIEKKWSVIFTLWIFFYIVFFSSYSKIVSEYYLNGTTIVWISIFSILINKLITSVDYDYLGVLILSVFTVFNLNKFFTTKPNESGYIQRKEIISEIKRDSIGHGYPCVSISYITDPGYDLGYRYFIYLEKLKIKEISKSVPVYTIVFPLKQIFPVNLTRGAIGLIYPNYQQYNKDVVEKECVGDDFNISKPLWGFAD